MYNNIHAVIFVQKSLEKTIFTIKYKVLGHD